jgi:hypothetical protein
MFDWVPVVWARFIKHLVKNSWATLGMGPGVLALGGGHKGILARLLSLLFLFEVAAGSTFVGVLLLLLLSLDVMENCTYRFLAESKVGGNVQELPSGAWALAPNSWTSSLQVVPVGNTPTTSASVMLGSSVHYREKRRMYS